MCNHRSKVAASLSLSLERECCYRFYSRKRRRICRCYERGKYLALSNFFIFFSFQKSSRSKWQTDWELMRYLQGFYQFFFCWRNSMELERERERGRGLNQREINFFFVAWYWSWNNSRRYINLFIHRKNNVKKIWILISLRFREEWKPLFYSIKFVLFSETIPCQIFL